MERICTKHVALQVGGSNQNAELSCNNVYSKMSKAIDFPNLSSSVGLENIDPEFIDLVEVYKSATADIICHLQQWYHVW